MARCFVRGRGMIDSHVSDAPGHAWPDVDVPTRVCVYIWNNEQPHMNATQRCEQHHMHTYDAYMQNGCMGLNNIPTHVPTLRGVSVDTTTYTLGEE